ncbi:hypothetical protein BP6252_08042 [Coleophoma cylindrospora]|uniref:PQ loop repeat protein n=1 Tax=Coleophoma cylindrospora TaxID=1849047 RepID=A0A3D8RBP4_9HELO|nr:hypothetical protein BP6252_08042 [Coleophoma cylindrospora]
MSRVFYYPGAQFDKALLIQSLIMIVIQLVLLKVALDHRPAPSSKGGDAATPFATSRDGFFKMPRPYSFWQWRSPKPYVQIFPPKGGMAIATGGLIFWYRYWQFLLYLFITLTALELLLSPFHNLYPSYSTFIGYIGLAIEATLPLPQIMSNYSSRSCKGFRLSVIINWLAGDAMKMFWFFTATTAIPWPFKLCGIFQACCDSFLGYQFYIYGSGPSASKEYDMREYKGPSRADTPMGEKDGRLG